MYLKSVRESAPERRCLLRALSACWPQACQADFYAVDRLLAAIGPTDEVEDERDPVTKFFGRGSGRIAPSFDAECALFAERHPDHCCCSADTWKS